MRPFTILVIDDATWDAYRSHKTQADVARALEGVPRGDAHYTLSALAQLNGVEVYLARTLSLREEAFRCITPQGVPSLRGFQNDDGYREFLRALMAKVDVLLLDLGGVSWPPKEDYPTRTEIFDTMTAAGLHRGMPAEATVSVLNRCASGAAFYIKYRGLLENCQAVIIQSEWDGPSTDSRDPGIQDAVRQLLDPFCSGESRPFTRKFNLTSEVDQCIDLVRSLHSDSSAGYLSKHRGAVEFAASTDLPVLIVGETGVGKEYVARAIHNRWLQVRARRTPPDGGTDESPPSFCAVNCATLMPALARSELFGHVRGAFTGADNHDIGMILKACGVRGTSVRREGSGKAYERLREQARRYREFEEALGGLLQAQGDADSARPDSLNDLRVAVIDAVLKLVEEEDYTKSCFYAVASAVRALERASTTVRDYDEDYRQILTEANRGLLERVGGDLVFREGGPRATLFLDEFGELPPEVQTLLLRYLDSGEVQPLGFHGRILGARVRVIAATSDPGVARFAGAPNRLFGSWRNSASSGLFRIDLLYRVRKHVIRVEGISPDPEQARQAVDALVDRSPVSYAWTEEARADLARKVANQAAAVKEATEKVDAGEWSALDPLPVFGHWRDVQRVVDLADAYVAGLGERGERGSPEVTHKVIDAMWAPAIVSAQTVLGARAGTDAAVVERAPRWKLQEFQDNRAVKPNTVGYRILEALFSSLGRPMSVAELAAAIGKGDTKKDHTAVRKNVCDLRKAIQSKDCGWTITEGTYGLEESE